MLTLKVTSFNGQAPAEPIEATFGASGGTIGRADGNHMVLPDPARHISRLHARVVFKGDAFELIDQGGNPIDVNGAPLGARQATTLRRGDHVRIGGYAISVVESSPAPAVPGAPTTPDDPFADLPDPGRARGGAVVPAAPPPRVPQDDPLAALGGASASDPLGLGFGGRAGAPAPLSPAPGRAPAAGVIPDDFDPFANPFAVRPPVAAGPSRPHDDFDLGLGGPGGTAPSLDAAFGLEPSAGDDPFASGPLSRPAVQGGGPGPASLDPLAHWGAAPVAPNTPSVADHVPAIHASFKPPVARPEPAQPAPAPLNKPPVALPVTGSSSYQSWEEIGPPPVGGEAPPAAGETRAMAGRPAEPARQRAARVSPPESPAGHDPLLSLFDDAPQAGPAQADPLGLGAAAAPPLPLPQRPKPEVAAPPIVEPAPSPTKQSSALPLASTANRDDLTQAFLAGLGCASLPLAQMTPETMERIGMLLREATRGTLELLTARAMTKREMQAEVTMIAGKDNNPLKFSPSAEAALAHLLMPQGQGFMAPAQAMRDAYDDLRAHQFGFMAGLRAALAGVLRRFDPVVLEQRLVHKSMLDSLLPINRRAKLWDLYEHLYREIASEAEDDFHTLFGREFVRAYEEQVARLDALGEAGRAPAE